MTAAIWLVARAGPGASAKAWRNAVLAGLILGLGVTIRVDVVLAGAGPAVWAILFAARPLTFAAAGIAGLVPGLALSTWLNLVMFGHAFPVSYGAGRSGGVSPDSHLWLVPVVLPVLAGCAALRWPPLRRRAGWLVAAAVTGLLGAAVVSPAVARALGGLFDGAHLLLWDMQVVPEGDPTVLRTEDGTVLFMVFVKKALGQSLPWLGILAVFAVRRPARADRPGWLLLVLVAGFWMLPFPGLAWHGGFSSNMRYFLPIVPCLAILGALGFREISRRAGSAPADRRLWLRVPLLGVLAVIGVAWATGEDPLIFLLYAVSRWLLLVLAILSVLAVVTRRGGGTTATAARGVFLVAVLVAVALGSIAESLNSQIKRFALADRDCCACGGAGGQRAFLA